MHCMLSVINNSASYGYNIFTVLHATLVCMYAQYEQGLCQFMIGRAGQTLTHVAHVRMTAQSRELDCCQV
jgi:hypothetical protein